jgi:hypothetical protein
MWQPFASPNAMSRPLTPTLPAPPVSTTSARVAGQQQHPVQPRPRYLPMPTEHGWPGAHFSPSNISAPSTQSEADFYASQLYRPPGLSPFSFVGGGTNGARSTPAPVRHHVLSTLRSSDRLLQPASPRSASDTGLAARPILPSAARSAGRRIARPKRCENTWSDVALGSGSGFWEWHHTFDIVCRG